jgi:hypothetical protein
MQIPDVFYDYCIHLHQDSFQVYGSTPEEVSAGALKAVSRDRWPQLRTFIEELLAGSYSEADLMKIIRSTDDDMTPRGPDGARKFLTFLRYLIDAGGTIPPDLLKLSRAHVIQEPLP